MKRSKTVYLKQSEFSEVFSLLEQVKLTYDITPSTRQLAAALIIEAATAKLNSNTNCDCSKSKE